MSRLRRAGAAICLAVVLWSALPAALAAQRGAEHFSAVTLAEPTGDGLLGSLLGWARSAFSWLQALTAAEHGTVVEAPVAPPTP